ncbi:hypothetical protein [Nocardia sp. BMG51109]|uniref:WXG100-like domain-containing protein n=1 Tax=Nocardia sp. BMG51109 TaxID=1056816 RepID=UPI0004BA3FA0|nr:hypothetical protein [Nocardia sp. BMG51109]
MAELPGWLTWLEWVAGSEWPDGDPDRMWNGVAQPWREAAEGLREISDDILDAKVASLNAYPSGAGIEEITKAFDQLMHGKSSVEELAKNFDLIAESAYQVGTEIEYTQLMFITSLGLLAAEIAAAWIWPPTAPAVQATAIAFTRIGLRMLSEALQQAVRRIVTKMIPSATLKFMARHVAIDTALGLMQEIGIQAYQVGAGHRKGGIDWGQVLVTGVSSAAGGAAAGPLGDKLGNALGKKLGDSLGAKVAGGAITGTTAGLAGAGAGYVAATGTQLALDTYHHGWDQAWGNAKSAGIDPHMFSAGASNGAISGANKAGATHFWNGHSPELMNRPGFGAQLNNMFDEMGVPGGGDGSAPRGSGESNLPGGKDDSSSEGSGKAGGRNVQPAGSSGQTPEGGQDSAPQEGAQSSDNGAGQQDSVGGAGPGRSERGPGEGGSSEQGDRAAGGEQGPERSGGSSDVGDRPGADSGAEDGAGQKDSGDSGDSGDKSDGRAGASSQQADVSGGAEGSRVEAGSEGSRVEGGSESSRVEGGAEDSRVEGGSEGSRVEGGVQDGVSKVGGEGVRPVSESSESGGNSVAPVASGAPVAGAAPSGPVAGAAPSSGVGSPPGGESQSGGSSSARGASPVRGPGDVTGGDQRAQGGAPEAGKPGGGERGSGAPPKAGGAGENAGPNGQNRSGATPEGEGRAGVSGLPPYGAGQSGVQATSGGSEVPQAPRQDPDASGKAEEPDGSAQFVAPVAAGEAPPQPARSAGGGGKEPPSNRSKPAGSPDDPGDDGSGSNRDDPQGKDPVDENSAAKDPGDKDPGDKDAGDKDTDNKDTDYYERSPLAPTSIEVPEGSRDITIEIDGEQVTVRCVPDGDGGWKPAPDEVAGSPASRDFDGPEQKSRLRRLLRSIREFITPRGYEGGAAKYPSGSRWDSRGQAAIKDGIVHAPDLLDPHPPSSTPPTSPTPPDGPQAGPGSDSGSAEDPVARMLKESVVVWKGREYLPFFGQLSSRMILHAGDHVPTYNSDGVEYKWWLSDEDLAEVHARLHQSLDEDHFRPEDALEDLRDLLEHPDTRHRIDPELRHKILLDLARFDTEAGDEAVQAILDHFDTVTDPALRQQIIRDLKTHYLIDTDQVKALEEAPIPDPPPESGPDPDHDDGPPPDDETLQEMAERLGFRLPDDDPRAIRAALAEQEYRCLRAAAAIEGLADAARRYAEEETRPYVFRDADGTERRVTVPIDMESVPRSFFDDNPAGHFLTQFMAASGDGMGLRQTQEVGNGADPLPEWTNVGENPEFGRDDGTPGWFEHALRRDQLADELQSWRQMFGLGLDEVIGRNPDGTPVLDGTLARLREENDARAERLAELMEAAEAELPPEQPPVGETLDDQAARIPVGEGDPDRLVVIDGPRDRDEVLADVLAADRDLADAVNNGEVVVDYRQVRDEDGHIHLDRVDTPEVRHHRGTIDDGELVATMVRHGDGEWRAVPHSIDPSPADGGIARPRSPQEMLGDLVDVARDLGLTPEDLTRMLESPQALERAIADLKLDNAVRAGQLEALSDFARSMNDIQDFYDLLSNNGKGRSPLAQLLGLSEEELTAEAVADRITDPEQRNAVRRQQLQALTDYAALVRRVGQPAVDVARDRFVRRLLGEDTDLTELSPERPEISPKGPVDWLPVEHGLDPKKLFNLVLDQHLRRNTEQVRAAFEEFAGALLEADPYSHGADGNRVPADPRGADTEAPVHDTEALPGLRDVIADAVGSADPREFGRAVAEAAARVAAEDGVSWNDSDPRLEPAGDWSRLVGVDVADADPETQAKVYEAYRDGRIDKHEGPEDLPAAVEELREEVRQRQDRINRLAALAEELRRNRAVGAGDEPGKPSAPPDGPPPASPRVQGDAPPLEGTPPESSTPPETSPSPDGAPPPEGTPPPESAPPTEGAVPRGEVTSSAGAAPAEGAVPRAETTVPESSAPSDVARDGGVQRDSAARVNPFDAALERAVAQAKEASWRNEEQAARQHEELMRRVRESQGEQAAQAIRDAARHEIDELNDAFRRNEAEAERQHQRLMDEVERLRASDVEANDSERQQDPFLTREEIEAEFRRRNEELEQDFQDLQDWLAQFRRGLFGDPDGRGDRGDDPPDAVPADGPRPEPDRPGGGAGRLPADGSTSDTGDSKNARSDAIAGEMSPTDGDSGADGRSRIDDDWLPLDPDGVAERLRDEFGVDFLDYDGVDPDVAREIGRSVEEMFTRFPRSEYPQMDLRLIRIGELAEGQFAKTTAIPRPHDNTQQYSVMTVNRTIATDLAKFHRSVDLNIGDGRFHRSFAERPVRAMILHEMGHVLDNAGSKMTRVRLGGDPPMDLLRVYVRKNPSADVLEFEEWLKQLSGYSFTDPATKTDFRPGEGLAEGFAEVMLWGDRASEPAHALYDLLEAAARNAPPIAPDPGADPDSNVSRQPESDYAHGRFDDGARDRNGDEWARPTPEEIAEILAEWHGLDVSGFDQDGVNAEIVRDIARATDRMLGKHRQTDPRSVGIGEVEPLAGARSGTDAMDGPLPHEDSPGGEEVSRERQAREYAHRAAHDPETQADGWLAHVPDPNFVQVWELLSHTEVGREAADVLREAEASVRFSELGKAPAEVDSFNGRTMDILIATDGRTHAEQAAAVVRAAERVRAIVSGDVEVTPARIAAMDRSDHLAAHDRIEAAAFGRKAEFEQQLRDAGFGIDRPFGLSPAQLSYRDEMRGVYRDAYNAAVDQARNSGVNLSAESLRGLGREAGTNALLVNGDFDAFGRPGATTDEREAPGREWDAAHDPAPPQGAAPPAWPEYVPHSADSAQQVQRLVREHAAATRRLRAVEESFDRAFDGVTQILNMLSGGVQGPAFTGTRAEQLEQMRQRDPNPDHSRRPDRLLMEDLIPRHAEIAGRREAIEREIAERVGLDLLDTLAADLGAPVLHTELGPADLVRITIDESGVVRLVHVSDDAAAGIPDNEPAAAAKGDSTPRSGPTLADWAADQWNGLRLPPGSSTQSPLRGSPVGRWAVSFLDRLGIDIRFSGEPEVTSALGYDPATGSVRLSTYGAPEFRMGDLIRAAVMADLAGEQRGWPQERSILDRAGYVDRMLDRQAEAHALAFEDIRQARGRDGGRDKYRDPLEVAYLDAHRDALRAAERMFGDSDAVHPWTHEAAAFRAGVRAVRARLHDLGPTVDGGNPATFYAAEWDRAHGIPPSNEVPPQPLDIRAVRAEPAYDFADEVPPPRPVDSPALRGERAHDFADEIETIRVMREAGTPAPVGPAERVYGNAYDKAYRKAVRAAERSADAPPPEQVAYEAGRKALRRYIDKVGLNRAEIAFDVVRAAIDGPHRRWGSPPEIRETDTSLETLTAAKKSTYKWTPEQLSEVARTALDRELDRTSAGERLTDNVALLPSRAMDPRPRLLVIAEAGGHLDALRRLAEQRPEYIDALWDGAHRLEYRSMVVGENGLLTFVDTDRRTAEGQYRMPEFGEATTQMLAHYLRYRSEGLTDLGYDAWLAQLGPYAFDTPARSRFDRSPSGLVGDFVDIGFEQARNDPTLGEPHPAHVAEQLKMRRIPTTSTDGLTPRDTLRYDLHTFQVGGVDLSVWLERDGSGGWRVPAPTPWGDAGDVLSRYLEGMSDADPQRLVNRIAETLRDGTAALDPSDEAGGGRLKRIADRLLRRDEPPSDTGDSGNGTPRNGESGYETRDRGTDPAEAPAVRDVVHRAGSPAVRDGVHRTEAPATRDTVHRNDSPDDAFVRPDESLSNRQPPTDDVWSALDRGGIVNELGKRYPWLEIRGFDSETDVVTLREYARAVDEILSRHPQIDLRRVEIADLDGNRHAEAAWRKRTDGTYYAESITLDRHFATHPEELRASKERAERTGYSPRGVADRPVYATIVHELGHALDYAGGKWARDLAEDVLLAHYKSTRGHVDAEEYHAWLRQLSRYSFQRGALRAGEALADAFLDVALNGRDASEPARVLHALLTGVARFEHGGFGRIVRSHTGNDADTLRGVDAAEGPEPDGTRPPADDDDATRWANAEYDRLMQQRRNLARELEFWHAKLEDRIDRNHSQPDEETPRPRGPILRSNIPHPPHDDDLELPEVEPNTPIDPCLSFAQPEEPPHSPEPPHPPRPPHTPVPPAPPEPAEPARPPDPPKLPQPPDLPQPPELPVPPELPQPPELPVPPESPTSPYPPQPPQVPDSPVPPGPPDTPVPPTQSSPPGDFTLPRTPRAVPEEPVAGQPPMPSGQQRDEPRTQWPVPPEQKWYSPQQGQSGQHGASVHSAWSGSPPPVPYGSEQSAPQVPSTDHRSAQHVWGAGHQVTQPTTPTAPPSGTGWTTPPPPPWSRPDSMRPSGPPGAPAMDRGNAARRRMFTTTPKQANAQITVQAYGGFGEYARFDPATGRLEAVAAVMQAPGGVYGELGGVSVVFYRNVDGLALRVGDRLLDLEPASVSVVWEVLGENLTRFMVVVGGAVACELRYRAMSPGYDIGLLIRDVCADPDRRARIFGR